MPKQKTEHKTLIPPRVSISKLSTRYDLYVDVTWGNYTKQLKLTKEAAGLLERTIEAVSSALLEASEVAEPYL